MACINTSGFFRGPYRNSILHSVLLRMLSQQGKAYATSFRAFVRSTPDAPAGSLSGFFPGWEISTGLQWRGWVEEDVGVRQRTPAPWEMEVTAWFEGMKMGLVPWRSSGAERAACRRNSFIFLPQAYLRAGDMWEKQVQLPVPECTELAAVWYSGKSSGPGQLELGAVVGKVSAHFKDRYLCVQRACASLYFAARNMLSVEMGTSFHLILYAASAAGKHMHHLG